MEPVTDNLKSQLNELCRFSRDLGAQSERVSALIKEYNSLSLQAARECQNKEKLLEQRFRTAFRDFQQWLVNTKINTAKCFDVPQSIAEASAALLKVQEFLNDKEQGQTKLDAVVVNGELLCSIVGKDRVDTIRAKVTSARDDWKSLMSNLHKREIALQNLQAQIKDLETSAEPLQAWLTGTESAVLESSTRLHDLPAKRQELLKLQEKASRIDRIVSEHQLFSQGLRELQSWVTESNLALQTYCSPTADKNVLDRRMIKLEALLAARQEKEIQLKMLITRGESVQRNTSPEGVPVIRKQIQDLKDSWDSLLSASIQCKSQLEGALSQWTSYQDDVRQFMGWMEAVEVALGSTDKQYSEMRDKTANLGRAKLLYEEVISHLSPLETIAAKGANMVEHGATQLEVQELQERYATIKEKAKGAVSRAEELVLNHQEYQRGLHVLEDWLEQEQEKLGCCSALEGDVEALENTLQQMQELEERCSEGQALLASVLASRERVIPWGLPQIEDRALETVQQDWRAYRSRLAEARTQHTGALNRLRQMEHQFQRLEQWLTDMEAKGQPRAHRQSDKGTKEEQLQMFKCLQEEALGFQEEVEGLGSLAQQVLDEAHVSSRCSTQAAQLTVRYHTLLLQLTESIKQLQDEIRTIDEAQSVFSTFSDWLSTAQENFHAAAVSIDVVDRVAMERKMKKLEALQRDVEQGHGFLKAMREKTEQAVSFLGEAEAERLRGEVGARLRQLEELLGALRAEHGGLEKRLLLTKEFLDKYRAQAQWVGETRDTLRWPLERKVELYQKKAQLAKYKTIQQTVESHESAIRSVVEKGELLLESVRDSSVAEDVAKLQADFQELCTMAGAHVASLAEQVKEHEAYNLELQDVERWLLQMSSRMVAFDPAQSGSMEGATQQLAAHKAIMEEIAGFEERLSSLKELGDDLVASCSDHLQAKVRQQVQAHQQGTRDSYSAICSTAQRVYQSLDRELQKHVSHKDTLQQCQTWLASVQKELRHAQAPVSLQEALQQVKHDRALQEQGSTYLDLVCSVCDLSDQVVRDTAAKIQQVKLMIEKRMSDSQDLAESWKEIKEQRSELETHFQDMEQQLQNLSRRPAELEIKIAENVVVQTQEFRLRLQEEQSTLARMTEKVSRLTEGLNSPEHAEVERLSCTWLELCEQADEQLGQTEQDLRRTQDYHNCINTVELLFEQVSKQWDNLARTDTESSSEHLEALKKLALTLEDQRSTLDELKEHRQRVIQRLNLDDKELVKEQVSHFEQRWAQLEGLIEKKIQESALTLEDMSQVESRLREAREWAEEQQPALSQAMKMSPPPELAQSFLFDHLSVCSELEAKQLLLVQAVSDADRVLAHLGLNERQRLQQLISDTQAEVESLSAKVVQRRKYLSKAFTERTQFLLAVGQATTWVQQNERKTLAEDHIALLPDDLSKQVRVCRGVQSSLRAYQSELTSLWSQGRDLIKDATEDEKVEIMAKLQELQNVFETALQKCTQRLQELEKMLVSRKYFKVDLDKTCQWLKQADIVTFPEINLMNGDAELHVQLVKYQQILEQATEYENLLLIVQRAGQEILPTLNEVDHCYLDEKLNALPQQYNNILALAKEKREKIQQAILARKEYASFIEVTHKALKELEDQFIFLGKQPVGLKAEDIAQLRDDYRSLLSDLADLSLAVNELNQKKEGFRSTGQPWRPDEMAQLVSLHNGLKRLIEQRVARLDSTLECFEEHRVLAMQLDSEIKAAKDQLAKVSAETQPGEERLKNFHALTGSLQGAGSILKRVVELMETLTPHLDQAEHQACRLQANTWQEELQLLQSTVGEQITECENRFVESADFQAEVRRTLDWLQQVKDNLDVTMVREMKVQKVQEEIRRQQMVQEEVQSRMKIVAALSSREKQKYNSVNELVPPYVDDSLVEIARMEGEVQQEIRDKQATLKQVAALCQEHHSAMQAASGWVDEAQALLNEASLGVDVESCEEALQRQAEVAAAEHGFLGRLEELEVLAVRLESLVGPGTSELLRQKAAVAQQRGEEINAQLRDHLDILNSCVAQWRAYQDARQEVVGQMNEAELKLAEFSTAKAATWQEAEDKLQEHKALVLVVNSFQDGLVGLEERAALLAHVASDASRAAVGRSVAAARQRWTRLRTVARGQEKILEATAHEWRNFREKMEKVLVVAEDLQSRVPDGSVEKASKAGLQTLLEYHDSFAQEVEREHSALALLRQYALNLPRATPPTTPVSTPLSGEDELPSLQEIRAMQERYDSVLQQVRRTRAQVQQELQEREEVERELGLVKSWIQDTQGLLPGLATDEGSMLQELEVLHGKLISHRQNVERIAEQQQSKYLDLYTILPSEISMQLAEVTLTLGSLEEQLQTREREIQQTKDIREDFSCRIHDISEKMRIISVKLKEKAPEISQAKEETKALKEELESCGRSLSELDAAVQEFGEQNPTLSKQLKDAITKLKEIHHHTGRLADYRTARLKKAGSHVHEFSEMLEFVMAWTERAEAVVKDSLIWSSSSQLQDQINTYQLVLQESRELHTNLDTMAERAALLSEVLQTEAMNQQVSELGRHTEELQQNIRTRLQSLQDAAKDMERLELEVRDLQAALESAQGTLTSPELARLSLKEQLAQRQRLLTDMEGLKQQVQAVQACQSGLRVPEEAVTSLPICRTALALAQEASQLQHTAIQQCNILQEAVVQYEQYEQEVRHLQRLIEEAHRVIQDRPVSTSNIQELQAQILHHEELAQKIRGYQEQIATLNSKCNMLTVKAKHATMLLTVAEVEGLSEGLDELDAEALPTPPPVVMAAPGRSSPDRGPPPDLFESTLDCISTANLDDLQQSWETLKNVISEKQKTLYEALERQQGYQDALQSISTKMESVELRLNEGPGSDRTPESQMAAHQALMDDILMLQDEISDLQSRFGEELAVDGPDADSADQLAVQSTLTVLAERMATIRMKASGKRQLLEELLSEQLEEQRQEQALQRYRNEADELDHWLLCTRAALSSALSSALQPHPQDMDMEEQLIDCQNMLLEMEQKVVSLAELSVHSESLVLEGRAQTRRDAEQLAHKLHTLKGSLLELQRMLQDKQVSIQGSLQEQEISEPDSGLSQSPSVQDWLAQARSTRCQQHQDSLQRQKELEEQLAEQKKVLQSVADLGKELMTPNGSGVLGSIPPEYAEGEVADQTRNRWEDLSRDLNTKLQLLQNTAEQDRHMPVYSRASSVSTPSSVYKEEPSVLDKSSIRTLFEDFNDNLQEASSLTGGTEKRGRSLEQQLYSAVCSASSWTDDVESSLFSGHVLLAEGAETQLCNQEALGKDVREVEEEVGRSRKMVADSTWLCKEAQAPMEEALDYLHARLETLDSVLEQRCEETRRRLQELSSFQTELRLLFTALAETKRHALQRLAEVIDRPAPKQAETIAEAEESVRELEQRMVELKSRGEVLQPDQVCTQELLKLQDAYEELVHLVGSRRSGLNQNLALKVQCEQALQDLVDLLDTAQDKMAADQKMIASSVDEVQNVLDKHKEFFQGLESHMILTETLFRRIGGFVLPRENQALEETLAQAQGVLKQAHKRGVELEYVLESWTLLEEQYQALLTQLEAVEASIPTIGLVEETEERLAERIALYQRLKAGLAQRQPQLYQALEDGKRLLLTVSCSGLEAQLTQLAEHWLSCSTRVNKELHRLDSTLRHWARYQAESAELNQWLRSALDRLEFWSTQSVTVPLELETVRDHLYAFLEFSKEVDAKSSLKASVLNTGGQLLRLKKAETAVLRAALGRLDTQWAELLARIPIVQEKLHQLQMEKLASLHAITELMSWISLMENVIEEDEEKIDGAVGSEAIQSYLQKYKGFKIDLNCKQLTVDFVNQSVLQISSQDVESKRSDKTDFAEKLGAMNRRWHVLQGRITEKIQLLEGLLESWTEYENSLQTLRTWFAAQEEKLKKKNRIEDLASVQNALKDCQELEEMIREKEKDVEKVEERGHGLILNKREEICTVITETLQSLNHTWANLDHMTGQLKISLKSVLEQWNLYKRASEEISGYLMEGQYSVSRFRLLTGSPEAVMVQVENLQNLQEELEKQENSLRKFGSLTHQLLKECQPAVADVLNGALKDVNLRWNGLLEEIGEQLRSSKALQQLWQRYQELYGQSAAAVQRQEERANRLLQAADSKDAGDEEVSSWVQECIELLQAHQPLQESLHVLQELGEQLRRQVDTSAAATLQSDHLSLAQRLAAVEQALVKQQAVLQAGVQDYQNFSEQLDKLDRCVAEAGQVLKTQDPSGTAEVSVIQARMEELKGQMLRLSSMGPDLERLSELGYQLPLSDAEVKRVQRLNRSWASTTAQATERFSKLQAFLLEQQSFLEKCEAWMEFLEQTEEKLAVEISGNYQSLLEQQRAHEIFQAEMFCRQLVLHSIISDGQRLLEQGQVNNRDDFSLKLALLSNQWHGVVRRAQQRRGIIDSLLRQWQRYREMARKLRGWLTEAAQQVDEAQQGAPVPLQQVRCLLDEVQLKEKALHRQQGSYILAVEAARQLLLSVDSVAEAQLQAELTEVQERWRHVAARLEERRRELDAMLKDWERCEKGIGGSLEKLRAFKRKLSLPLPDHQEALHSEQIRCKELENTLASWTEELSHLGLLKGALLSGISSDDLSVMQERIQLLHRQWEEICHQLALRRQQVNEKLNEWAIFSEKHKELCDWLTQMESKVSQNGDISIEEMIDKLRKDYQEEMAVAKENRLQLQQMGERLAKASHEGKATEIGNKLSKANERWQHLLDLIAARVRKLRETLVAMQQLDKNMSSLKSWLAHMETQLARPIIYDTCDAQEIEKKLGQQQELQRDIEKHSTGVASVLNLCEVLLHDSDAYSTEADCESIQQATRSLDRRWRTICATSMERRLKIEETGRLWQKFLDDFLRFESWLSESERTAALPNSSGVLYTVAKEELKKFEAFQRQVQENLTQLELINKQYRRLARENRTDSSSRLRQMVHDGNQRWDNLQKRAASILRRLKHFISQREEFEAARDSILVWLTEMDLQLTNIEHFSECDVQAKIRQLKAFQQEISLNTSKMEHVFHQGEVLIEKSEPLDATVIEEELEELQRYCQEVFGRVERYYKRLTRLPFTDDEHTGSDHELDLDDVTLRWNDNFRKSPLATSGCPPVVVMAAHAEPSGRDTPASVDSIPLEWDHDYDLETEREGGSQDRDLEFLHGAAAISDVVIPESPEAYVKLTERTLMSSTGEPDALGTHGQYHLQEADEILRSRTPTSPDLSGSYTGYMRLMGECRSNIDAMKRMGGELSDGQDELLGLVNLNTTESQTLGVIERWELAQAQAQAQNPEQNLQRWQQLHADLDSMLSWLHQSEEDLLQLRRLDRSLDIHDIELRIRKLKELQKAVDYRKPNLLSINLSATELFKSEHSESQEVAEAQLRLTEMNGLWERLGTSLEDWRQSLQEALMHCHDFHEMSHGLLLWLENIDRRRSEVTPIDASLDQVTLLEHHGVLRQIQTELLDSQQKVTLLEDMSVQLLVHTQGGDSLEAGEKVHVISNRLKLLLKEVTKDLQELEELLRRGGLSSWSSVDERDTSGSGAPQPGRSSPTQGLSPRGKCRVLQLGPPVSRPYRRSSQDSGSGSSRCEARVVPFLLRVLRAALPLQLLLLLLLVLACLVPATQEDYSCALSNNFARSFHPMLRYTNGPPPI